MRTVSPFRGLALVLGQEPCQASLGGTEGLVFSGKPTTGSFSGRGGGGESGVIAVLMNVLRSFCYFLEMSDNEAEILLTISRS